MIHGAWRQDQSCADVRCRAIAALAVGDAQGQASALAPFRAPTTAALPHEMSSELLLSFGATSGCGEGEKDRREHVFGPAARERWLQAHSLSAFCAFATASMDSVWATRNKRAQGSCTAAGRLCLRACHLLAPRASPQKAYGTHLSLSLDNAKRASCTPAAGPDARKRTRPSQSNLTARPIRPRPPGSRAGDLAHRVAEEAQARFDFLLIHG
jgi:hypothetical protein